MSVTAYWYIGAGIEQPRGPIREKELIQQIAMGQINAASFICNPMMEVPWVRICELEYFSAYLPEAPTLAVFKELDSGLTAQKSSVRPNAKTLIRWYLQVNSSELGPITLEELQILLGRNKGKPCFVWRPGLKGWQTVASVPELGEHSKKLTSMNLKGLEKRKSKRKALLAEVIVETQTGHRLSGLCRDISPGGILFIASELLEVGTEVKIKVVPVSACGITKFVAAGKVTSTRDPKGMAIEFTGIHQTTRKELQNYIESKSSAAA